MQLQGVDPYTIWSMLSKDWSMPWVMPPESAIEELILRNWKDKFVDNSMGSDLDLSECF